MKKKIKVALIFKKDYNFFSPSHFDQTTRDFFLTSLKEHPSLEISYHSCEKYFDAEKLNGKCDVVLLANNRTDATPDNLIGLKKLGVPVISRTGDPHHAKKYDQITFHEKWNISCYFGMIPPSYFYKFYPANFRYEVVTFGVEMGLYQNLRNYDERIKNRILNSGATGKLNLKSRIANLVLNPRNSGLYFYKLRTLCNTLSYVDYKGLRGSQRTDLPYPEYLSQYRAAIAATTHFPTQKYYEIPAAGCLTFMEITPQNDGYYLGFKDNENAIFINEKNYKDKFEEFLSDPDNLKWKEIAFAGKEHVINYLTNDVAKNRLVKIFEDLL